MDGQRFPSPPATPPPRLTADDYSFGEPSPSKLFPVDEEETGETVERFNQLLLEDQDEGQLEMRHPRPYSTQRGSDTMPSPLLHASHFSRPRNRSPYSRPHLRSQSSSSSLSAPPMTRAHSSPAFSHSPTALLPSARSSSPLRSPKRARSPYGWADSEQHIPSSSISDIESIDEDHELDITPRASEYRVHTAFNTTETSPSFQLFSGNSLPLRRRRPASPLHQVSSVGIGAQTSNPQSPLLGPTKFDESFPTALYSTRSFSSSSMPSTPTSLRSRSPSISSLETIPDTPDAEAEAIEAEKMEGLRRASEGVPKDTTRASLGIRDKRKRWSVCGAEKRSDLNLETIWEDGS